MKVEAKSLGELQVVWFKRDFRLADHAALTAASKAGPVLALYIYEPALWALPERSGRQDQFMRGALASLERTMRENSGHLSIRVGDVIAVLTELKNQHGTFALHAHEETGDLWTYRRDRAVYAWCRAEGVAFHEYRQFGIERGGDTTRNGWAKRWDSMMEEPNLPVPSSVKWVVGAREHMPAPKPDPAMEWVQ